MDTAPYPEICKRTNLIHLISGILLMQLSYDRREASTRLSAGVQRENAFG